MEFYHIVGQEVLSVAVLPDQERKECIDYTVTQMLKNRNFRQIEELTNLVEDDLTAQDTHLNGLAAALMQQAPNVSPELVEMIRFLELKMEVQELVLEALLQVHRGVTDVIRETITILEDRIAMPLNAAR
jgi:hypothetical protein